jgi:hypothetical protein
MSKKIKLELTKLEFIALIDSIDTYSSLCDGINDDGTSRKDLKKVDEMLKKNGYKRIYN